MKVAITGSNGLIGSALVVAVEARGDTVVRVVRGDGDGIRWDPEHGTIEALIEATARTAQGDDAHAIEAAVETLAQGTEAFAAARMNQGIRQALAGRRIEDV